MTNPLILSTSVNPIKEIREKLHMSQAELAERLGLRQSHISACELNKNNLSVKHAKTLISLARAERLGVYVLDDFYPD